MIFKKLNLEFYSFTEENINDITNLLNKGLRKKRDQVGVNKNELAFADGLNDSALDPDAYAQAKPSTDNSTTNLKVAQYKDLKSMKSIDDQLSD